MSQNRSIDTIVDLHIESYYDIIKFNKENSFPKYDLSTIDLSEWNVTTNDMSYLDRNIQIIGEESKEILHNENLLCPICDCNSKNLKLHRSGLMCKKCVFLTGEPVRCMCHTCMSMVNEIYMIRLNDRSHSQKFPRHKCNQCNLMLKKNMFSSTQLHTKKMYRRCMQCIAKSNKSSSNIEKKWSYLTLKRTTDFNNYYNKHVCHWSMMKKWKIERVSYYGIKNYTKYVVFQYLEIKMLRHRVVRKELTISCLNMYMYDSVNKIVLSYVC
jgi:hypothetical protein